MFCLTVRIDATDRVFTHNYNSDGRLATLEYPSGYQVTYEYSGDLRALTALRETSTSSLLLQADGNPPIFSWGAVNKTSDASYHRYLRGI